MFGVASQIPSQNVSAGKIAAIPGTDFGTEVTSVVIPSGSISGNILIPLSQNFVESQLKVFSFRLTSVTRLGQQGLFLSIELVDLLHLLQYRYFHLSTTIERQSGVHCNNH